MNSEKAETEAKKRKINAYIFVDALGWEIVEKNKFMFDEFNYRRKIKMQFGYSSTAIPTILSGCPPKEHGHFSFFYYDKKNSPFGIFGYMKFLFGAGVHPKCIMNRGRVRRWVSKLFAKCKGYTGYFQLYAMPYDKLPYFDYCEKSDIFAKGGLKPVKNLRDILEESGIKYHISDWRKSESENIENARKSIIGGTDFAFVYTADFDSFMHDNVACQKCISEKLSTYETKIKTILEALKSTGRPFTLTVISDHGMTPTRSTVDLRETVASTGLKFGRDYVCVFDSTMLRLWYLRDGVREKFAAALGGNHCGRFVASEEKIKYGIDFPDDKFGNDIFLMNAGIQISPCDMGNKALAGMHGYSPEDRDSFAALLSTRQIPPEINEVKDYFKLMQTDIEESRIQTLS